MAEITGDFLKAVDYYMKTFPSGDKATKKAGLTMSTKRFFWLMREAYRRDFLVLRWPIDDDTCEKMRNWAGHQEIAFMKKFYVATGRPDDWSFSLGAAERLMIILKELLLKKHLETLNIGIVSGSSTASVVKRLVESNLWKDIMAGHAVTENKKINIIALNATPVTGWELEGNANIATLMLATMLGDKLGKERVRPYGISTDLVIKHQDLETVDGRPANRRVLEIADPQRVAAGPNSKLNLVITGVGTPANSVFEQVLSSEGINMPNKIVGDVAFWPVDENGQELHLMKDSERYIIYSAIGLKTMEYLATKAKDRTVVLIARNSRRGEDVDKTKAIRAAIRGNYVNEIFTDTKTAEEVMTNGE